MAAFYCLHERWPYRSIFWSAISRCIVSIPLIFSMQLRARIRQCPPHCIISGNEWSKWGRGADCVGSWVRSGIYRVVEVGWSFLLFIDAWQCFSLLSSSLFILRRNLGVWTEVERLAKEVGHEVEEWFRPELYPVPDPASNCVSLSRALLHLISESWRSLVVMEESQVKYSRDYVKARIYYL